MPISNRLKTKIRLTMLYLSVFELYSRWVPLKEADASACGKDGNGEVIWKF